MPFRSLSLPLVSTSTRLLPILRLTAAAAQPLIRIHSYFPRSRSAGFCGDLLHNTGPVKVCAASSTDDPRLSTYYITTARPTEMYDCIKILTVELNVGI